MPVINRATPFEELESDLAPIDDDILDIQNLSVTEPTLKTLDGDTTIKPDATTKLEGELHSNSTTHTDLCGHSKTEKNGDKNWRVTIEGVLLKDTFEDLKSLRPTDRALRLVSDGHTGDVVFDIFTWTQQSGEDSGAFTKDGLEVTQPIFTFQLQTKEEESSGGV